MAAKEIIKRNFSRSARHYDRYSAIQDRSAVRLIEKTSGNNIKSVLDIGCGTGNYTSLLRKKFPDARIAAIDISPEMIAVAKGKLTGEKIKFVIGDAEEADFDEKFDLISSNSSFQWFEDLQQALSKYKKLLTKDGTILFSTFGPRTFFELSKSVNGSSGRYTPISSNIFPGRAEIKRMLKGLFRKSEAEDFTYKKIYLSLSELLKSIKYTGVRGDSEMNGFWTPSTIRRIEKKYKEKFKEVVATYEIFICMGTI